MSKLDAQQFLDYINLIQLRCNNLVIVHRPGQTLTDNTDITHRQTIKVTNKMCVHPSRGEHSPAKYPISCNRLYNTVFTLQTFRNKTCRSTYEFDLPNENTHWLKLHLKHETICDQISYQ